MKVDLQEDHPDLDFDAYTDERSLFRYELRALPDEISSNIGTSTLLAAWNAAVYVAQINDEKLTAALGSGEYLHATREVLQRHGGLWFQDETFVVARQSNDPPAG